MSVFDRAIVSPAHDVLGKTARGDDVTVIASATQTNGVLGIWVSVIAPGTGPDWHCHTRETEVFHVLSGSFRFWCGTEAFDAGPGFTVVLPPNVPHQWKNIGGEPGRLFSFVSPGGFERNFTAIAAMPEVTDERLHDLDRQLGATGCPAPAGAQPDWVPPA